MDIQDRKEGEVTVLDLDGDLNTPQECGVLERKVNQLFESGVRCLVLDCSRTPRVSAAAIRLLLLAQRRVGRAGGSLVLCGLSEIVRRVFAISGFDRDFTIVATAADAVARAVVLARERRQAPGPVPPPPMPPPPVRPTREAPAVATSPVAALAAELAESLAPTPALLARSTLTSEQLERLSAQLLLALAARRT